MECEWYKTKAPHMRPNFKAFDDCTRPGGQKGIKVRGTILYLCKTHRRRVRDHR